ALGHRVRPAGVGGGRVVVGDVVQGQLEVVGDGLAVGVGGGHADLDGRNVAGLGVAAEGARGGVEAEPGGQSVAAGQGSAKGQGVVVQVEEGVSRHGVALGARAAGSLVGDGGVHHRRPVGPEVEDVVRRVDVEAISCPHGQVGVAVAVHVPQGRRRVVADVYAVEGVAGPGLLGVDGAARTPRVLEVAQRA